MFGMAKRDEEWAAPRAQLWDLFSGFYRSFEGKLFLGLRCEAEGWQSEAMGALNLCVGVCMCVRDVCVCMHWSEFNENS